MIEKILIEKEGSYQGESQIVDGNPPIFHGVRL